MTSGFIILVLRPILCRSSSKLFQGFRCDSPQNQETPQARSKLESPKFITVYYNVQRPDWSSTGFLIQLVGPDRTTVCSTLTEIPRQPRQYSPEGTSIQKDRQVPFLSSEYLSADSSSIDDNFFQEHSRDKSVSLNYKRNIIGIVRHFSRQSSYLMTHIRLHFISVLLLPSLKLKAQKNKSKNGSLQVKEWKS